MSTVFQHRANILVAVGATVLRDCDALADAIVARVSVEVPEYQYGAIDLVELRSTVRAHVEAIFAAFGSVPLPTEAVLQSGRDRALARIPLAAVLAAYRVAADEMWRRLVSASVQHRVDAQTALDLASVLWTTLGEYSEHMTSGYQAEMSRQIYHDAVRRSDVIRAVILGTSEVSVWDARALLDIPTGGVFVVVVATSRLLSRAALPEIEGELRTAGMRSAWMMNGPSHVGLVHLGGQKSLGPLTQAIAHSRVRPVGISHEFHDLRDAPSAHRAALAAMRGAAENEDIVVADQHPFAGIAAGDTNTIVRVARSILAPLDSLGPDRRAAILETFQCWLDHRGSIPDAAIKLHCHPNTVRYRLRQLEGQTGRALNQPRHLSELTLAFEIERRTRSKPEGQAETGS